MTSISVTKSAGNPTFAFSGFPENIIKVGATYYCPFMASWPTGMTYRIHLASASNPEGPWTDLGVVLAPGGGWEGSGLDLPFLIAEAGTFYLYYSSRDIDGTGAGTEEIGFATAATVTGPYTKHVGNPVLTKGGAGAWDHTRARGCSIVKLPDTTFLMCYEGGSGPLASLAGQSIGIATAPAVSGPWTKSGANPVMVPGSSGAWDDNGLGSPHIWQEADLTFWMMFTGSRTAPAIPLGIGIATAPAPTGPWTENIHNPFLAPGGAGSWEETGPERGGIYIEGGDYFLTYGSFNAAGTTSRGGTASLVFAPEPTPPVGWDVFASDDLNGPIIATLVTARGRYVRDELNGLGEGGFSINRHSAEATEAVIKPNNLVRPHIAECGGGYLPGFFIGPEMDPILASQQANEGGELLTVKGPGLLSYLDRARMTECAYSIEGTITDTWTELWHGTNVPNPAGIFYDPADTSIIRIISETTRRVYTVRQADRVVTAVSAALFTHYAAGLSGIPGDATHYLALEAPWLSGSTAHSYIHKVLKATNTIVASYDIGTDHWTALKSDGTNIYLTNYSDDKIYKKTMTGGAVSSTHITYNGVVQTKPTGVSINGTEIDYWFSGTKRMLRADTSAYATITSVVSTQAITAFGGEWDTTTGTHLYMDSVDVDEYWKFQLAIAVPACADSSGVFHPEQTSPGALAARVLAEITHVDRPDHPVPDLSYDFDFDNDSNGNAWPARTSTEEFTWRVGDRAFSDVLARLIPGGVTFRMDPDAMILHAYVTSLYGTDRTSGAFGAGKIRFVPGDGSTAGLGNISSDLRRRDNRGAPDTYMTVAGDNGAYGHASVAADYIQEGFMQVTGTSDTGILDSIAADELARQRLASDAIGFEALWGDDEAAGLYLPYKHYQPADLGRVHTGTGQWDFNETDWRVYAIMLTERDGGFRQAIEAGSAYKVPPPTTTVVGNTSVGSGSGAGSSGSGSSTSGMTSLKATDSAGGSAVGTEITSDDWIVYQPGPGVIKIRLPSSTATIVVEEAGAVVVPAASGLDAGHGLDVTDEGDGVAGLAVDETELDGSLIPNLPHDAEGAIVARYTFSTTTTDSDPGNGVLRLSNASQYLAVTVRADLQDVAGADVTAVLDLIGVQTASPLGYLRLQHSKDPTKWLLASVSAIASPSGYRNITIANVAKSANSPFANGDPITLVFVPGTVGLPLGTIPTKDTPATAYGTPAAGSATTYIGTGATIAKPTAADVDFSADVTTNNVTTGHHGLAPKAPNDATKFLDGTGAFSIPAGTGTIRIPVRFAANAVLGIGSLTAIWNTAPAQTSLLVCAISSTGASCPTVSSITQTNVTWTKLHGLTSSTTVDAEVWVGVPTGVPGTTVTVAYSNANSVSKTIQVMEWPYPMAATLDHSADTTGTGAGANSGVITPTVGALCVAVFTCANGTIFSSIRGGPVPWVPYISIQGSGQAMFAYFYAANVGEVSLVMNPFTSSVYALTVLSIV
jgi:hypothetical protein